MTSISFSHSAILKRAIEERPYSDNKKGTLPARLIIPHLSKWDTVVTIGDSVNEGLWDSADPAVDLTKFENQEEHWDGPVYGWADRLAGHLSYRRVEVGLKPVQYANLAIRGKLIEFIVDEEIPQALKLHPDLVIMDGGGNDILRPDDDVDSIMRYIEHGIKQIREAGIDLIFLIPPQATDGFVMDLSRYKRADYVARLQSMLLRYDCYAADLWEYKPFKDPRLWSQDRIHPTPECHERAAQIGLIGLGLGCDPGWDHGELWTTLPYMKSPLTSKVKSTLQWDKNYLTPWLSHRYHNVSSGDGRDGKRRQLSPMPPSQPHPGSLILAGKYGEPDFNGPSDPDWIRSKVK
ncbi:MAG: SGNH/GDSL hydrolase family protein [Aeriscardovia sp.]|nr:SGNH/GDSL hydrolase family protein [Aeriscardovia sp.]